MLAKIDYCWVHYILRSDDELSGTVAHPLLIPASRGQASITVRAVQSVTRDHPGWVSLRPCDTASLGSNDRLRTGQRRTTATDSRPPVAGSKRDPTNADADVTPAGEVWALGEPCVWPPYARSAISLQTGRDTLVVRSVPSPSQTVTVCGNHRRGVIRSLTHEAGESTGRGEVGAPAGGGNCTLHHSRYGTPTRRSDGVW